MSTLKLFGPCLLWGYCTVSATSCVPAFRPEHPNPVQAPSGRGAGDRFSNFVFPPPPTPSPASQPLAAAGLAPASTTLLALSAALSLLGVTWEQFYSRCRPDHINTFRLFSPFPTSRTFLPSFLPLTTPSPAISRRSHGRSLSTGEYSHDRWAPLTALCSWTSTLSLVFWLETRPVHLVAKHVRLLIVVRIGRLL